MKSLTNPLLRPLIFHFQLIYELNNFDSNIRSMKSPIIILLIVLISACGTKPYSISMQDPDGVLEATLYENESGDMSYTVSYKQDTILAESTLGFQLRGQDFLGSRMELIAYDSQLTDTMWKQVWGEDNIVEDHNWAYRFQFEDKSDGRKLNLHFKLYKDGLGFRYEFPEQEGFEEFIVDEELTEFTLTGDHTAWWIPADYDSYEYLYNETKVSEIDSSLVQGKELLASVSIQEKHAASTPLTMKTASGMHISIHEANLTNYPSMTVRVEDDKRTLSSSLVPSDLKGWKAKLNAPFKTPWRTIQVGEKAGDLLESKLILNLNEPNKMGNPDWIKPQKYVGIWWEMHLQMSSWDIAAGKHGATTKNAKNYIDFAAKHGFEGVLIEGWNTGWEKWIGFPDREGVFDFVTPYPDFDIDAVNKYAAAKGVKIIMHHETSAAVRTYEQQLDTAYALMEKYGMNGVKTGYVGPIIPEGEYHHGQWMVNHYRKVLSKAAQSEVMVFAHEPIKATGLRRTYPNMMSREGLRGSEFNAWGGGNPPEHLTIVPFTRMLAGPIDYTPGIFRLDLDKFMDGKYVPTTLAYQLAEYVVIYSPVQMASDLPEHYEQKLDAFQFIKDVPVDWEETVVMDAEIGEYVMIRRLERASYDWYLGALTNEKPREFTIDLDFLLEGVSYEAQIYADAADAHYLDNPEAYKIEKRKVKKGDMLNLKLAAGGGVAIRFKTL